MSTYIRSFNPIWANFDLSGLIFDDTFYLYVLENEIPYLPAEVYNTPNGTPWTNPIQFLGNGTLPVNIYWNPDQVYRLEFRQNDGTQPPSQNDALIYLVENYQPGSGGGIQPTSLTLTTENQITNPQFSIINFVNPYAQPSASTQELEIAPGWVLELVGSGSVTVERDSLNSTDAIPTNAPYALRINTAGTWTSVVLRQRFQQAGMLWANKTVSNAITCRIQGAPQTITAILQDSLGNPLGEVLNALPGAAYTQFTGHATLGASVNTDLPPDAYIEYRLVLPVNIDIYVTSFQLIAADESVLIEFDYEQDTIERQVDHTFHYYKQPLEFKPIPSILVGWDFALNPSQFHNNGTVTISANAATSDGTYAWDQTICGRAGSNIDVTRSAFTSGFQVTTTGNDTAFYMLQYLDGAQVKKILGVPLSVNVSAFHDGTSGTVNCKVYLFRAGSTGAFPAISADIIGSMDTAGVFTLTAANWTEIPRSDLGLATGDLSVVATGSEDDLNTMQDLKFNGWEIISQAQIADTNKFAIVVTFEVPTTASVITVDSISLVQGDIATRPAPQAPEQVLKECEAYYEKSYPTNQYPASPTYAGSLLFLQSDHFDVGVAHSWYRAPFTIKLRTQKRAQPTTSTIILYSPTSATPNLVQYTAYLGAAPAADGGGRTFSPSSPAQYNLASSQWNATQISTNAITFLNNTTTAVVTETGSTLATPDIIACIELQYVVSALIGVI